ncbi:AMP-binding protein [Saccharopolyspora endophytica]|uniref:AMP-binding protein n=1 Tax=Saccharopolyspora endophytica TaxID=543886 RepID=A0ABS5DB28_9PSEU|nr:AMP-binding protein [Saccharopolyspora endophytica]MBQ0923491.1 AMP-binding protein [Saccharopolyspora endophytica]
MRLADQESALVRFCPPREKVSHETFARSQDMTTVDRVLAESYWPADEGESVHDVTIGDLLREAAATVPDRTALVDAVADQASRRSWTYAEFLADATRAAQALLARFSPGDRVAIWAPNSADWIILQQGISLAGMIMVASNPAYRARELEYVLRQSGAVGLFYADSYRDVELTPIVEEIRPRLPDLREAIPFSRWQEFLGSGADVELPPVAPTDPIQVQYTSGTTGFPKGARLHHKGLANAARFVSERAGMGDGGVNVNSMPMYHIGGGAVTSLGTLAKRGTFVIVPQFDPALMLETFETYRGTHSLLVPTMLIAVLDHPDREKRDLTSLQTIMSGAATVPASLVRRAAETLGCRTTILFGQTEMHGVIAQTRVTDSPEDQSETVGQPLPHLEVKIADEVTGEVKSVGEAGEICCRGYQNMIEYHEMPEETESTIDSDGWLHMGDWGCMDERGFIKITGRLKDMIIRGGVNIYPREIEEFLISHPAVAEVAVVGVPDEKWGEQLAAVVRLNPGADKPTVEDMRAFCRAEMSAHKTPAYWSFVGELPMTPTGKVKKYVLREQLSSGELDTDTHQPDNGEQGK